MTDFIIIGNTNAVTHKEIFPLFKDNKVRLGCNTIKTFCTRNGTKEFGNVGWFSTLPVKKKTLTLTAAYDPDKYPKYENYDAININRIKDIPYDYDGVMGVPITFLDKYCPSQFDIIWQATGNTRKCAPKDILKYLNYIEDIKDRGGCPLLNGNRVYSRLFIRKKISE